MKTIVVREHARLTSAAVERNSMDEAQISESAFDWLCRASAAWQRSGARLVQVESRRFLRLDNYVGVIETPCGTRIEILPKIADRDDDASVARGLLQKMLARCLDLKPRTTSPTDVQTFRGPVTEWVMEQFLQSLDTLVKRGVRFEYHAVREEQRFLRGRLDITRQLRQAPGREHLFQIEHDIFDADRPENRLLRSALDRVCALTSNAANWRLSHELAVYLAPVPSSVNIAADFRRWRNDRLLAHYQPVRPWCELILGDETPLALLGNWHGASLLFSMEQLFERYVETCLRRMLPEGAVLKRAARAHHLATHNDQRWFRLEPDFLLQRGEQTWVLDTKWKRLDQSLGSAQEKYGLNQSDFYQLYAYGQRYLSGVGEMLLVYPMTSAFTSRLASFQFSETLTLWVVPFDLEKGCLVDGGLGPFR